MSQDMAEPGYEARRKAENQRASGNIDGAIETLEAYLYTDPHNCRVRMDLARLYIIEKDNKDFGMVQLDAILDIDPEYDDARKALVSVLKNNKRYTQSERFHTGCCRPVVVGVDVAGGLGENRIRLEFADNRLDVLNHSSVVGIMEITVEVITTVVFRDAE